METNTWYIYKTSTRVIINSLEGTEAEAIERYSNYDSDIYSLTCTPAFGAIDGLIDELEEDHGEFFPSDRQF